MHDRSFALILSCIHSIDSLFVITYTALRRSSSSLLTYHPSPDTFEWALARSQRLYDVPEGEWWSSWSGEVGGRQGRHHKHVSPKKLHQRRRYHTQHHGALDRAYQDFGGAGGDRGDTGGSWDRAGDPRSEGGDGSDGGGVEEERSVDGSKGWQRFAGMRMAEIHAATSRNASCTPPPRNRPEGYVFDATAFGSARSNPNHNPKHKPNPTSPSPQPQPHPEPYARLGTTST